MPGSANARVSYHGIPSRLGNQLGQPETVTLDANKCKLMTILAGRVSRDFLLDTFCPVKQGRNAIRRGRPAGNFHVGEPISTAVDPTVHQGTNPSVLTFVHLAHGIRSIRHSVTIDTHFL